MTDDEIVYLIHAHYATSGEIFDVIIFARAIEHCTLTKQKARWYQEGVEAGLRQALVESPNSATDVVEPYNGWILRKVYFEDGEPLMHSEPENTQAQELSGKTQQLEAEIKRLQELADYRLKLLTKIPSEWVSLTDEEILAITFDAKITEPNDEPIKFGAPSRKCIKDLISGVEARLKEKQNEKQD